MRFKNPATSHRTACLVAAFVATTGPAFSHPADKAPPPKPEHLIQASVGPSLDIGSRLDAAISATSGVEAPLDVAQATSTGEGSGIQRRDPKFVVLSGSTMHDTLQSWALAENWTLMWELDRDFVVRGSSVYGTSIEHAVASLSDTVKELILSAQSPDGAAQSGPGPFSVTVYRTNRVIRVHPM